MTVEQIIKDYEIEKIRKENLQKFAEALKYLIDNHDLITIKDFITSYGYTYEKISDETERLTVITRKGFREEFRVSFTVVKFNNHYVIQSGACVNVFYNEPGIDKNIEVSAVRNEDVKFIDELMDLFRP